MKRLIFIILCAVMLLSSSASAANKYEAPKAFEFTDGYAPEIHALYSLSGEVYTAFAGMRHDEFGRDRMSISHMGPMPELEIDDLNDTFELKLLELIHRPDPQGAWTEWFIRYNFSQSDESPAHIWQLLHVQIDGKWYNVEASNDVLLYENEIGLGLGWNYSDTPHVRTQPGHYRIIFFRDFRDSSTAAVAEFELRETENGFEAVLPNGTVLPIKEVSRNG